MTASNRARCHRFLPDFMFVVRRRRRRLFGGLLCCCFSLEITRLGGGGWHFWCSLWDWKVSRLPVHKRSTHFMLFMWRNACVCRVCRPFFRYYALWGCFSKGWHPSHPRQRRMDVDIFASFALFVIEITKKCDPEKLSSLFRTAVTACHHDTELNYN